MSRILDPGPARFADAARSVRHVFIRDLALDAHIGVHRHEHGRTQPIRVNVDLAVAETAERTGDRLEDVVCYQAVADRIRAIVARGHVKLVETLAEMVAQACLEDPRVLSARIRIEKPDALPGASSVGVEIERTRPEYVRPNG
jgi:7,8-dihydroneopterin aldolase/epimerase/oxygenase